MDVDESIKPVLDSIVALRQEIRKHANLPASDHAPDTQRISTGLEAIIEQLKELKNSLDACSQVKERQLDHA